jgi:undecaprenyl-diphosphatase
LDTRLERWVVHHRVDWLDWFFVALSRVGSAGLIWLVIAAVAAVLYRRPAIFFLVLAGDFIADWLSFALRQAIGRDRPPVHFHEPPPLVQVPNSGSFPSGHTATSFACATLLAWLTPLPKVPLFVLAILIGFSRVYVGVHYPLDVVGGAVLGVAVATALRLLVEARRRSTRSPQAAQSRSRAHDRRTGRSDRAPR